MIVINYFETYGYRIAHQDLLHLKYLTSITLYFVMTNLLFAQLVPNLLPIHQSICVPLHFGFLKKYFSGKVSWWRLANQTESMSSYLLVIKLCELHLSQSRISTHFKSLRNLLFSPICLFAGLCFIVTEFQQYLILLEF